MIKLWPQRRDANPRDNQDTQNARARQVRGRSHLAIRHVDINNTIQLAGITIDKRGKMIE